MQTGAIVPWKITLEFTALAAPSEGAKQHRQCPKFCRIRNETKQLHAFAVEAQQIPSSLPLISLYSNSNPRFACLQYARSVFDKTQGPDSRSWNTIKRYLGSHRSHDALILFCELLLQSRVLPYGSTFPCILKGCARLGALEEGEQIHGLLIKIGYGSDVYVQGSLVSFYSKCGRVCSARKVFERMVDRDLASWNAMMDGYVKCGEVETARKLFEEMIDRDVFSWTVMINGYSRCRMVEVARCYFDRMPLRNLVSWNAMIDGYMKDRDCESAIQLFNEMPVRNSVTWSTMINGFVFNCRFMAALETFQSMLKEGTVPNKAALVGVLSSISGLGRLDKARWIHSYVEENGFKVEGVLGTLLIDMYSKCGCIEDALDAFRSISRRRLGHWNSVIVGLGMHGMASLAFSFFAEMQRNGIKPNGITFIGILTACSHVGLVDEGCWYFEMMKNEYGMIPTTEHYGCLVDLLCRAGHLEEAKDLIESMPMKPNEIIWMSLLSGCRNHVDIEIGEYAANRVIELAPDLKGCYILLSNIYAAAGLWDSVSASRTMMMERGLRKDPGYSKIEHGGMVHTFIVGDRSHPEIEGIYSKLNEMHERLKFVGYIPDTSQVLLCVEEGEKEVELAHHSERLAIAFGLINIEPRNAIRVMKNLRICKDCHAVTKFLSDIYDREIIVKDNSRFHHFKKGSCSCGDYW